MLSWDHLRSNLLVKLGEVTDRTHALPMLLFAVTARCNSRCTSCDWWRADGAGDLTLAEIKALAAGLAAFGTRVVVLTGGEPLVRPDIIEIADAFRAQGLSLHLLTSGLALERYAEAIARRFEAVTISLDAHTAELYEEIRGVNGLAVVAAGVAKLRALAPHVRLTARSTLHRLNYRHVAAIADKARELGLDQVSFLAADLSSDAFNRPGNADSKLRLVDARPVPTEPASAVAALRLDEADVTAFEDVIESVIRSHGPAIERGQIAPSADGLRRLVAYYRAHLGQGAFPAVDCNAPWMSVFIEANGAVRPCFFHAPVGNIRETALGQLLNEAMPAFRRALDMGRDPTCQRCVCTLKVGLRSNLW